MAQPLEDTSLKKKKVTKKTTTKSTAQKANKIKTVQDLVDFVKAAGFKDLSKVDITLHSLEDWTDSYIADCKLTGEYENEKSTALLRLV